MQRIAAGCLGVAVVVGLAPGVEALPGDRLAVVEVNRDGVGSVDGLDGANAVAVSPDGAHVYAAGADESALAVFERDPTTGKLTVVEVQRDGVAGVDGLAGTRTIVVAPDGGHVYTRGDSIVIFARNPTTGALTFVASDPVPGFDLAISPDGLHVYADDDLGGGIALYTRNITTGVLTFVERAGQSEVFFDALAVAPDGAHVYRTRPMGASPGFFVYARNATTGQLSVVDESVTAQIFFDVAVSPDDADVYVLGQYSNWTYFLRVLERDATTGLLTSVQEIQDANALTGARDLAVSPDGTHVYTVSKSPNYQNLPGHGGGGNRTVAVFRRDVSSGLLTLTDEQVEGIDLNGLEAGSAIAVSPDDAHVYATGALDDTAVVFRSLTAACSPTPLAGCRVPVQVDAAKVSLKNKPSPGKDSLRWTWKKGAATDLAEFGDPVGAQEDYVLCVYDGSASPQPVQQGIAVGAALCGGQSSPCWKSLGTAGYSYAHKVALDGLKKLKLRPGAAGEVTIVAAVKGVDLAPPLPLTLPVSIQLQAASGLCWEATFDAAIVNDGELFKAFGD